MKHSNDYHDYVFKDGKIVGKFEEMYRYSQEIPWHQDKVLDTWHGRIGINLIEAEFEEGEIKTVLETGCGYGYVLSKIKRPKVQFSGFDISETAIKKARKRHP
jgi:SAM-dependent methyltransferase|tara:strand:- start:46 stop:354 length:309 start_codon:yes stop_codon:yes gene_type:complete